MTTRYMILAVLAFSARVSASSWNNLSCPAPRAPDNGLSFIFRNGELVHFRCHPGYEMRGTPVAYCVNNVWTNSAPECIPIRKWHDSTLANNSTSYRRQDQWKQRELFNWGSPNVYGDGPRRLPLINGIWPPQEQVLALATPGPNILVKEEIDIAELRHRQLEELKRQRIKNTGKHKQGQTKSDVLIETPRETLLSLGATDDGKAFSVAFAKPVDKHRKHRHHRGGRHKKRYNAFDSNLVTSRKSRVNTSGYHQLNVAELRRRPVEQVQRSTEFDTSCLESINRREVPMIAPQIPNAFVYRYETKRNQLYPFNNYMEVKYKCLNGFIFATNAQTLYCKEKSWVGEIPRCISAKI